MAKIHVKQNDLSRGVINKALEARTDLEAYSKSVQTLDNMVVMREGGVRSRFGTKAVRFENDNLPTITALDEQDIFVWDYDGHSYYFTQTLTGPGTYDLSCYKLAESGGAVEITITLLTGNPIGKIYDNVAINNTLYITTSSLGYCTITPTGTPTVTGFSIDYFEPRIAPQFDVLSSFYDGYSSLTFTCSDVTSAPGELIEVYVWTDSSATTPATYADFGAGVDADTIVGGMFYSFGLTESGGIGSGLGRGTIRGIVTGPTPPNAFGLVVRVITEFAPTSSSDTSRTWDGSTVVLTSPVGGEASTGIFRSVAVFESRLTFGNLTKNGVGTGEYLPRHVFFSQTGEPDNFDLDNGKDSGAITLQLDSKTDQTPITFMQSNKAFAVFTSGGMYASSSWSSDAFTPSTASLRQQDQIGTLVRPAFVDNTLIFISSDGRRLWGAQPNDDAQTYKITQLNELATDLFGSNPTFIEQIKFGPNNQYDIYASQLVLIGYDSYSIIMQIQQEENIIAFSKAFSPVNEDFSRTYISPLAMGTGVDGTYILSALTVAGGTSTYLQWVEPSWLTTMDNSITVEVADQSVVSSYLPTSRGTCIATENLINYGPLLHEGPRASNSYDGLIPTLNEDFSAGYVFEVSLTTLPVHVNTQTGDSLYTRKRIVYNYVQTYQSAGFTLNGEEIDGYVYPITLDDGKPYSSYIYKRPSFMGWKRLTFNHITYDQPYVLHIIGLAYDITV